MHLRGPFLLLLQFLLFKARVLSIVYTYPSFFQVRALLDHVKHENNTQRNHGSDKLKLKQVNIRFSQG